MNPRTQTVISLIAVSASVLALVLSVWSVMLVREHAEQTARLATLLARFAQMPGATPGDAPNLRRPPPALDTSDE